MLGQPGWREWLGGAACLFGAVWLLSFGLPGAVPGSALLLGGLHYWCRRDELLLDAGSRLYLRRRGYPGHRRQWPVAAADLGLALRRRLNDLDEPLYELELTVDGQPGAAMSLGLYAGRDDAVAARDRQARRLDIACNHSSSTEK
ncbi:MAG: hypothetical protein EPN21_15745 [Methylococcaceae bacterium]|nr:MAG: hypothetical protein EPN21_15745 [Methylococcaceae bacterium]